MDKLLSISEAAKWLGVSPMTLRRWEASGKLTPERTVGNQRRYRLSQVDPTATRLPSSDRKTLAYARVSSHDQKDDLVDMLNAILKRLEALEKTLDGVKKAVEDSQT